MDYGDKPAAAKRSLLTPPRWSLFAPPLTRIPHLGVRAGKSHLINGLLGLPDLPPPNWIVRRPANNHAHLTWTLAEPVHRYPAARIDPLRYLAWIAEYYADVVGADPGYAGVLAHNPA